MTKKTMFSIALLLVLFFNVCIFAADGFRRSAVIPAEPDDIGGFGNVVAGVDFDNDGKPEIYAVNHDWHDVTGLDLVPRIYKYEQDSVGQWQIVWWTRLPIDFQNTWPALTQGDLDQDGKWEIIWGPSNNFGDGSNANPSRIFVFETPGDGSDNMGVDNGDGTWRPNAQWTITANDFEDLRPFRWFINDIDEDGTDEIVTCARRGDGIQIYSVSDVPDAADGSETWTLEFSGVEGVFYDLAIIDSTIYGIEQSGDVTMVTWSASGDSFRVGDTQSNVVPGGSWKSAATIDVDNNGQEEIIVASRSSFTSNVYLLQQNGETLISSIIKDVPDESFRLNGGAVGDLDNDGNLDYVFGTRQSTPNGIIHRLEYQGGAITDPNNWKLTILDNGISDALQYDEIFVENMDDDPEDEVLYTGIPRGLAADELPQPLVILDKLPLNWLLPMAINTTGAPSNFQEVINDIDLAIGGDSTATDGFDLAIDGVAAPPGQSYYAYLSIAPPVSFLARDVRRWVEPFEDEITWTMPVVNADGVTSDVSWDPADLPPAGNFFLEEITNGINLNMRTQGNTQFTGNATVIIRYLPKLTVTFNFDVVGGAWYLISLPVIPDDNSLSTLFPDALAAFCWNFATQSYEPASSLQPERAYWLLFTATSAVEVSSQPLNSYMNNYGTSGWDMIGSVFEPSLLVDDPDNSVLAMFGWNAATQSYESLDPFDVVPKQGYWALVFDVPSSFTIGGAGASASDVAATASPENLAAFYARFGELPPGPPDFNPTGVATDEVIPRTFGLYPNYPNPFNPETRIRFDIPSTADGAVTVRLAIYNVTGQLVRVILDEERSAGSYEIIWDGKNRAGIQVPSGVYFYAISAGDFNSTRAMTLLK